MPEFILQSFDELTTPALYRLCQAREAVFVVEQNCPYPELDGIDPQCLHLQGFVDGELAVYARIIPPNVHPTGKPAIGRVLTLENFRGHGYGRDLMVKAIEFCQKNFANQPIVISAQTYLLDFYQSLGFVPQGKRYLEDNIEHIDMILTR